MTTSVCVSLDAFPQRNFNNDLSFRLKASDSQGSLRRPKKLILSFQFWEITNGRHLSYQRQLQTRDQAVR